MGQPISRVNLPSDASQQIEKILADLEQVNVQHNDTKHHELLVSPKGKICLCDFGWGSINNDLGCNIGIWSKPNTQKPGGGVFQSDSHTFKRLNQYGIPINKSPSKYMNKRRNNVGSQSEVPTVRLVQHNLCAFGGYQRFDLSVDKVVQNCT